MGGFVTSEMAAGRVVKHGQITDLTTGFSLADKIPFSIIVVPKANISGRVISIPTNAGILVECKCYLDILSSDYPIMFNQETPASILFIQADAIDLDDYDVYWGTGN